MFGLNRVWIIYGTSQQNMVWVSGCYFTTKRLNSVSNAGFANRTLLSGDGPAPHRGGIGPKFRPMMMVKRNR